GLIALTLLTVPYIPLARWELPLIFQPAETGFGRYTFDVMLGTLGNVYSLGILTPFIDWQAHLVIGLGAALAAFGLLESKFPISHRLSLLLWAAIPFISIFIISINHPVFTDRYLIWIEAAYVLLIAIAIFYLWAWHKSIGLAALIGLCVVGSFGLNAQATTPFKPDFRSAAQALAAEFTPEETIVFQIPYVRFNFDYYFHQPYKSIDGPYTNFPDGHGSYQDSQATVFKNLDALFNNQHSVWLVLSEEDMWDQRHLLRQWLSAHGRVTYQAAFAQVEITRYQLNSP
ncbi:MAG TPA: hypothetical protein VFK30_11195, partial [Anaerolineae bacterium]|nr:hypothetical protein [Anaerolineae bacterium]